MFNLYSSGSILKWGPKYATHYTIISFVAFCFLLDLRNPLILDFSIGPQLYTSTLADRWCMVCDNTSKAIIHIDLFLLCPGLSM